MDKVEDGESNQQLVDTWSELKPDVAIATGQTNATANASTSVPNQEADWVRDFAEHKTQQG